jgi:hypothetical protein
MKKTVEQDGEKEKVVVLKSSETSSESANITASSGWPDPPTPLRHYIKRSVVDAGREMILYLHPNNVVTVCLSPSFFVDPSNVYGVDILRVEYSGSLSFMVGKPRTKRKRTAAKLTAGSPICTVFYKPKRTVNSSNEEHCDQGSENSITIPTHIDGAVLGKNDLLLTNPSLLVTDPLWNGYLLLLMATEGMARRIVENRLQHSLRKPTQ